MNEAATSPRDDIVKAHRLDMVERVLLILLYGSLIWRSFGGFSLGSSSLGADIVARLPVVLGEGLLLIFMLIRKPADKISTSFGEWVLAFGAACLPLLVLPENGAALIPAPVGVVLFSIAFGFQIASKVALGRRFGCVPADRGLKLNGPYRVVRHPIYASYLLGHIVVILLNFTLWNAVVYAVFYALQIPRILMEEKLLSQDEAYRKYCQIVRYRLIPGIF